MEKQTNPATFRTMTPKGMYGSSYKTDSWDEADEMARKDGYEILDWTTMGDELILVIPDD